MIGQDVVVEDLAELFVGDTGQGAEVHIGGRIADENVDLPEFAAGARHQLFQCLFG